MGAEVRHELLALFLADPDCPDTPIEAGSTMSGRARRRRPGPLHLVQQVARLSGVPGCRIGPNPPTTGGTASTRAGAGW